MVICGDFNEPTENILNKFKNSNGIIFEATDDIASQVKELSLNLAEGNKSISKYYGCYYQKTSDRGRPWTEDIQLTADGNLIHPDEYYFYGESFDFETYFEKLKTNQIGHHIYHFNTISSTMV